MNHDERLRQLVVPAALALAVVVCAFLPADASAAIDPQTDSFGIYFDTQGTWVEVSRTPFQVFDAYLLLANPAGAVDGFECTVTVNGSALVFLATDLGPQALDVDSSPNGYAVGAASPYPLANSVLKLVHWPCLVTSTQGVYLGIAEATSPSLSGGLPVVTGDGVLRRCGVRSGSVEVPVACINAMCVVAEATTSFGAVKGLFR